MIDIYGGVVYGVLYTAEESRQKTLPDVYKKYNVDGYISVTEYQWNSDGFSDVIIGFLVHDIEYQHKPVTFPSEDTKIKMRAVLQEVLDDFKEPDYYLAVGISY